MACNGIIPKIYFCFEQCVWECLPQFASCQVVVISNIRKKCRNDNKKDLMTKSIFKGCRHETQHITKNNEIKNLASMFFKGSMLQLLWRHQPIIWKNKKKISFISLIGGLIIKLNTSKEAHQSWKEQLNKLHITQLTPTKLLLTYPIVLTDALSVLLESTCDFYGWVAFKFDFKSGNETQYKKYIVLREFKELLKELLLNFFGVFVRNISEFHWSFNKLVWKT